LIISKINFISILILKNQYKLKGVEEEKFFTPSSSSPASFPVFF
jgi:hypothetical protein